MSAALKHLTFLVHTLFGQLSWPVCAWYPFSGLCRGPERVSGQLLWRRSWNFGALLSKQCWKKPGRSSQSTQARWNLLLSGSCSSSRIQSLEAKISKWADKLSKTNVFWVPLASRKNDLSPDLAKVNWKLSFESASGNRNPKFRPVSSSPRGGIYSEILEIHDGFWQDGGQYGSRVGYKISSQLTE